MRHVPEACHPQWGKAVSEFVPTPGALAAWADNRPEAEMDKLLAVRAGLSLDVAYKAVLTALNEHQDWYHDSNENSAGCTGCSWLEAPTDIAGAPQKFREHQARMILLELDAA